MTSLVELSQQLSDTVQAENDHYKRQRAPCVYVCLSVVSLLFPFILLPAIISLINICLLLSVVLLLFLILSCEYSNMCYM